MKPTLLILFFALSMGHGRTATYYSQGSVAPNTLSNWNTVRLGGGSNPADFTSGDEFIIQNGHEMATIATWAVSGTVSRVWIEDEGTLTAYHNITLSPETTFQIDNGGTYIQNVVSPIGTTILQGIEVFGVSSNFIYNYAPSSTSAPTSPGYGNLTINTTTKTSTFNWAGSITKVQGNFTILSTGSFTITHALTATTNITVFVGGNLIISGTNAKLWLSSGSATCTMNVTGDVSISNTGSVLDLAHSSGAGTLNIGGNFSRTAGSLTSFSAISLINFTGSGKTFANSATGTITNAKINWAVNTGATLALNNDLPVATSRILTVNGTLDCGTTVLVSGAGNFTLAGSATLITGHASGINGSITITGTKTLNAAANYVFNGTTEQVTGTFLPAVVNNFTVDCASGVKLSNTALTINGTMLINAGKLFTIESDKQLTVSGTLTNNSGVSNLVLKSDATGTASLLHNSNNVDATIERYLTGNTDTNGTMDFHLVSVPLNASVTAAQFMGMYLYEFYAATQAWASLGSSTSTVLDNNKGYLVFYPNTNTTINFTGQLNNGTFTASTPTDAVDEFSLVPNPYPSAIDWDVANGWTKTNLQDAFYIWNPVNNNYATWSAGAGTASSGKIPVGQSFFVKSNAAGPVLSMTNEIRVHNTQSFYKETKEIVPEVFRLRVADSTSADELIVRFSSLADAGRGLFDADKFYGGESAPQVYSVTDNDIKLTINALDHSTQTIVVATGLEYAQEGQLEFVASGFESFESSASIFLEDKLLNKLINLKENPTYTFNHSIAHDTRRFNLLFYGMNETGEISANDHFIQATSDHIKIIIPSLTGHKVLVEVYDLSGRFVIREQLILRESSELVYPHQGMAIVRVIAENKVYSGKVFIQ